MNIKGFIENMLAGENGAISHKRVIASIGALCLFSAFMFKVNIDSHLADLIFWLVVSCMGLASIDKFTK